MSELPDDVDPVRTNRSAPARGTPPGRQPTGWRSTRLAFTVTAAAAVIATLVLVVVIVAA